MRCLFFFWECWKINVLICSSAIFWIFWGLIEASKLGLLPCNLCLSEKCSPPHLWQRGAPCPSSPKYDAYGGEQPHWPTGHTKGKMCNFKGETWMMTSHGLWLEVQLKLRQSLPSSNHIFVTGYGQCCWISVENHYHCLIKLVRAIFTQW